MPFVLPFSFVLMSLFINHSFLLAGLVLSCFSSMGRFVGLVGSDIPFRFFAVLLSFFGCLHVLSEVLFGISWILFSKICLAFHRQGSSTGDLGESLAILGMLRYFMEIRFIFLLWRLFWDSSVFYIKALGDLSNSFNTFWDFGDAETAQLLWDSFKILRVLFRFDFSLWDAFRTVVWFCGNFLWNIFVIILTFSKLLKIMNYI